MSFPFYSFLAEREREFCALSNIIEHCYINDCKNEENAIQIEILIILDTISNCQKNQGKPKLWIDSEYERRPNEKKLPSENKLFTV